MLFALTESRDEALVATRDDVEVRAFVADVEGAWDEDWLCEVDKAWDAMHRCLTDGTLRLGRHGGGPLELAVLGGGQHYEGGEYIVAHILADQVPAVAEALDSVDEAWLRERYDLIDPDDYQGALEDEDFEYTWHYLQDVRNFYKRAAAVGRSVIFTVDQ
ncbi:YfbM family protein [Dactylosporangium sp. CS-047395]|uniref:YfbM family protein n=1 Tax=Dactylosporangium sp. CS-047395 TaxID=3239936 RepID=UPI003D8B0AAC